MEDHVDAIGPSISPLHARSFYRSNWLVVTSRTGNLREWLPYAQDRADDPREERTGVLLRPTSSDRWATGSTSVVHRLDNSIQWPVRTDNPIQWPVRADCWRWSNKQRSADPRSSALSSWRRRSTVEWKLSFGFDVVDASPPERLCGRRASRMKTRLGAGGSRIARGSGRRFGWKINLDKWVQMKCAEKF